MKALITGASSGIGRDIARILSKSGYELILAARRKDRLCELAKEFENCKIIPCDLSKKEEVFRLYNETKNEDIDILINNAGFGLFGEFSKTELLRELEMIDLNVTAVHILTKLFLSDFKKKNSGYILNVASSAAFFPGPLMSTYYATKAYVQRLTLAVYQELKKEKSGVYAGVFCPGPVNTEFNKVADVSFALKGISSEYAAKYAVKKMFEKKVIIVPGISVKAGLFFQKFLPTKLLLKISYKIQRRKG